MKYERRITIYFPIDVANPRKYNEKNFKNRKKYDKCKKKCYLFCSFIKTCYLCTRKTKGAIAQLVEQRTENPCVPGSIPGGTTCESKRDVAQLVAHYVRDVGVGRSSRLIPTKGDNRIN